VTTPIDLVASMVLENGSRWGECALPEQWDDMEALLCAPPAAPRRHLWLRARGRSKTLDAGAATLATMLAGNIQPGDEMYAGAAGREQAGHLARKIQLIAAATPELEGAVDVQNFRVVTPRTGAVLDVVSSDLSSSWGKTPRWVFLDEFPNHDDTETAEGFVNALLTSLPKRRDSVLLGAGTPSSPNHWAHRLWDSAAAAPDLWRCSVVSGPAPWQDPAELEWERRRLAPSLWRRLFLCEWAELDDQLATMEQIRACAGHEGTLPPDGRFSYVTGVDLSFARDTTAVVTCHAEDRAGRRVLVLDRLRAWRPAKGRQVPLAEVAAYVVSTVAEYGGMVHADPYQAVSAIQEWRAAGLQVKAAVFNPQENSRRAALLLSLITERDLDLPEDPELFGEVTAMRLREGATPGVLKLVTDGSSKGHFDRAMALMLCAQELMGRPAGSYRDAYGDLADCAGCGRAFFASRPACPWCREANPAYIAPLPAPAGGAGRGVPVPVMASSWAAAYYPPNPVRCGSGHVYDGEASPSCPSCQRGGGRRGRIALPDMAGMLRRR
jgi:hypothetical protein